MTFMVQETSNSQLWARHRNQQGLIARSAIRRLAQEIVDRFDPERIILFGSYASGRPGPDSDVDLLVVMPARNEIDQSLRIEESLDLPFALDVIVRTPKNLAWRLKEGDWFLREALEQGKVLYEKPDQGVGAQSRGGLGRGRQDSRRKTPSTR
jgi:predicted nucleotidyltransferase